MARSIRRCASWSEIIADSCRYGSESVSALVARLFVYRWRISEVPFALLHGNYPYSQRNLAEIVRSMFLNSTEHLSILGGMKGHALDLYEAIQRGNFDEWGVWLVKLEAEPSVGSRH